MHQQDRGNQAVLQIQSNPLGLDLLDHPLKNKQLCKICSNNLNYRFRHGSFHVFGSHLGSYDTFLSWWAIRSSGSLMIKICISIVLNKWYIYVTIKLNLFYIGSRIPPRSISARHPNWARRSFVSWGSWCALFSWRTLHESVVSKQIRGGLIKIKLSQMSFNMYTVNYYLRQNSISIQYLFHILACNS